MVVPERIEREILIEAPIEVVWSVLTEPEHVAGWFSDSAEIDLRPGGEATFDWREHGPARAWVERVEPPRFVAFRWVHAVGEEQRKDKTTWSSSLAAEGDHTRMRVVESGFRELDWSKDKKARYAGENTQGWQLELDELPSTSRTGRSSSRTMRRAGDDDELWAAVADPTRRRLLDALLAHGEATATTLAGDLPVTRQAVAKHLSVLARAGLVDSRRVGREVRYTVRPERLYAAIDGSRESPPSGTTALERSSGSPSRRPASERAKSVLVRSAQIQARGEPERRGRLDSSEPVARPR